MQGLLRNEAKVLLRNERVAMGTVVAFVRTPGIMRMIAAAGYAFVVIDTEHSAFPLDTVADMCEVARAAGVVPIIRPQSHDPSWVRRFLDQGALGLMCPHVQSRGQVESLRSAIAQGAEAKPARDYLLLDGDQMAAYLGENLQLIVQVESTAAVDRIEEILAGGGVDVVEIGRTDLAKSFGVAGQRHHPKVREAVERVVIACLRYGAAAGAMCDSDEDAEELLRIGVRWILYSSDHTLLEKSYAHGVQMLRGRARALGIEA